MELGLATFADLSGAISPQQRIKNLLEEAEVAPAVRAEVERRVAQRAPVGA